MQDAGIKAPTVKGVPDDVLDSKPHPDDWPQTYPPPEYLEKAPPPKRVEHPGESDVPLVPAFGSTEGYRFDAKMVAFDAKPSGYTITVLGRPLRDNQAFFPTRAPSFYLDTKGVKIEAGTVLAARLGHGTGLWFQTINERGATHSFAARASYYVKIDTWDAEPFDGKTWRVAGRASGKLFFFVEGHNCMNPPCFAGAAVAGTFTNAPIRYFSAPP
ncbi:MAG: hypothetical protein U0183_16770 [Polyangiaceae bacterium]